MEAQTHSPEHAGATTVSAPLRLATLMPEVALHVTIEIRDTRQRELVTAIEILSPTNKRGEGRREYVTKRQRLLLSAAHLMEIDLLRLGERVPMQQPLPQASYYTQPPDVPLSGREAAWVDAHLHTAGLRR